MHRFVNVAKAHKLCSLDLPKSLQWCAGQILRAWQQSHQGITVKKTKYHLK